MFDFNQEIYKCKQKLLIFLVFGAKFLNFVCFALEFLFFSPRVLKKCPNNKPALGASEFSFRIRIFGDKRQPDRDENFREKFSAWKGLGGRHPGRPRWFAG